MTPPALKHRNKFQSRGRGEELHSGCPGPPKHIRARGEMSPHSVKRGRLDGVGGGVPPGRRLPPAGRTLAQGAPAPAGPGAGERGERRGFPGFSVRQIYPVTALQGAACVEHCEHGSMQTTRARKSPGKNKSVDVQMFPINVIVQPWWLRWEGTGLKIPVATPPLLNLSPHPALSSLN